MLKGIFGVFNTVALHYLILSKLAQMNRRTGYSNERIRANFDKLLPPPFLPLLGRLVNSVHGLVDDVDKIRKD
jgi:hypothetical protein